MTEVSTALIIEEDYIFGKVGFSITEEKLISITKSLYNYCLKNKIENITIGYDGSYWSNTFLHEVVIPYLSKLDIQCTYTETPCTLVELSWLTMQSTTDKKQKFLGVYLAADWYFKESISIYFRDSTGSPLTCQEVTKLINMPDNVIVYDVNEQIYPTTAESVNIKLYPQYLQDQKLLNTTLTSCISVDCMFGCIEALLNNLKPIIPKLSINLLNPPSNPWRLKNYTPRPSGNNLAWGSSRVHEGYILAGIDNCGSALGIWDIPQRLEISPSGIYMLLLYTYCKIYKKKGTILISKLLSDRVVILAKKFGFKVELIDSGTDAFIKSLKKKRRSAAIIYGDEFGKFWFKGDLNERNPILTIAHLLTCCEKNKKSPGALIDILSDKYFNQEYQYAMLLLPRDLKTQKDLEKDLIEVYTKNDSLLHSDVGSTSVLRLKEGIKIAITEKLKQQSIVIFIESPTKEQTLAVSKQINLLFTGDLDEEEDAELVNKINSIATPAA